jgi:hypothetical protein
LPLGLPAAAALSSVWQHRLDRRREPPRCRARQLRHRTVLGRREGAKQAQGVCLDGDVARRGRVAEE